MISPKSPTAGFSHPVYQGQRKHIVAIEGKGGSMLFKILSISIHRLLERASCVCILLFEASVKSKESKGLVPFANHCPTIRT